MNVLFSYAHECSQIDGHFNVSDLPRDKLPCMPRLATVRSAQNYSKYFS